jgi:hypothetical protein
MELKTLEGYEPKIKPGYIISQLYTKYKNEDWVLSIKSLRKKRNSIFGNKIWKVTSKIYRISSFEDTIFGFENGIVFYLDEMLLFGKGFSDIKVKGFYGISEMKTNEILENIVLLKKTNKILFKCSTHKDLTKLIKVSDQEIQFFDEFLRNCISENNSMIDKFEKQRKVEEQNLKELKTKHDSKKLEFLKKYDKDNNGIIDIIEGEDVFIKLFKKHQNIITETDKDYVHKFVKLSGYLKTKRKNIQQTFTLLKNNQFSDKSSSLGKLQRVKNLSVKKGISLKESYEIVDNKGDNGSINEIIELIELIENQIYFYNLVLFHSLNMINSISNKDLITFYEIYEYFDKFNLFNSNFENEVSQKLTDVGEGLTDIGEKMLGLMEVIDKVGREITNEIKDLNYTTSESFKDLKTSMVKELNEINSSLDFNVLLNGIQTYQIYKLNKNTKSLR